MVKQIKFLVIGIFFGIVLIKSEIISWFRIQEMFHFQSYFMYAIIGSAVFIGFISVQIIKRFNLRSFNGDEIVLKGKPFNKIGNTVGGLIFGFGWALTGACPGPLYALFGAGYWAISVALISALAGVITYGYLRPKLPH